MKGLRALTVLLLGLGATAAWSMDAARAGEIDAVFADIDRSDSPGCAVGVIRDRELVFSRGYGMASLEHAMPIDEQTIFYSGSVSKQFVAAAVAMAAREGYLALEDSVRKWFPELPSYADEITVKHLIHHTSGLRDYLTLMALAGVPFETPVSPDWVLQLIARQNALNFAPGSQYLYSNSGYFLLAQLVARATGSSVREYSEAKLFAPLGMVDTHWHDDRHEVVERRALAYSRADEGEEGFTVNWSPAFAQVGSGGLLTTIRDLHEWDRSYYDGRLGEDFWESLLVQGVLNDGEVLRYAFGIGIDDYRGHRRIAHSGAMFGYRAYLARYPEDAVSIALLCNLADANPSARAAEIAELVLDDLEPVEEEADSDSGEAADEQDPETDPTLITAWQGRYYAEELDATAKVAATDQGLFMHVGFDDPIPVTVFTGSQAAIGEFVEARGEMASGVIAAFEVDAGRVKGIRYVRRQ